MANWILSALMCAFVGADAECTLVQFTAQWCEPCQQIAPALGKLQSEGWTVHTVDVDRSPDLVKGFRIENLPTLVILCRQQEADRIVGAVSYERIAQRLARVAARNQPSQHAAGAPPLAGQSAAAASPGNGPIVRGQSPGLTGFPLLASAATALPAAAQSVSAIQSSLSSTPTSPPSTTAPTPTISVEQAVARAAAATVRIRVDEGATTAHGTGTIVDVRGGEALVLTCGHLFRDMQPQSQLSVDLFAGTPQEVNLAAELIDFKAEEEDIGLISCRLPMRIEPVPLLVRGTPLAVGQPAFSFGCDHGANPTRRDTQIKNINRYLGADNLEIVGAPVLGRSGGGLFDLQGRLIGVCNAANPEDDEGIYAAADVVYNQIERLGLSELFVGSATPAEASSATGSWSPSGSPQEQASGPGAVQPASTRSELQWPDQTASLPATSQPAGGTQQIMCIMRDAEGNDRLVTIDAPPAQLLDLIQQSSKR